MIFRAITRSLQLQTGKLVAQYGFISKEPDQLRDDSAGNIRVGY